jgi:hypothetical protein
MEFDVLKIKDAMRISTANIILLFSLFSGCTLFYSCKESKKVNSASKPPQMEKQTSESGSGIVRPPVLIYKTNKDYKNNVPVNLTADRRSIASYPDIRDIYYNGVIAYPTVLEQGYLLDNRGIGPNVAFLDYTYEQYQKLGQTPDPEELMKHVIDNDPLKELYSCNCEKDTAFLNKLIGTGSLMNCKKLK